MLSHCCMQILAVQDGAMLYCCTGYAAAGIRPCSHDSVVLSADITAAVLVLSFEG